MLDEKEIGLLEDPYFNVLETNEYFYKIESNNVKNQWIVLKTEVPNDPKPIVVYRKKYKKGILFSYESEERSIEQAITQIKRFDEITFQKQSIPKMNKKR